MIIKEKVQESGHWYTPQGTSAYTTIGKTGERPTTLRDAKKLGLLPSVTTIIGVANKGEGLQRWMQEQAILAALTLPRLEGEEEGVWLSRVMKDSKATGMEAAMRGTAIHNIIQGYFEQMYLPEKPAYLDAIDDALKHHFGNQPWLSERSFGHPLGFGGKCDLMASKVNGKGGFIVDFKTKTTDLDKVDVYFEHELQLAAYREGLNLPNARCAIVFVNGTTNQVKLIEVEESRLQKGWECFQYLLRFYQVKNDL